MPTEITLIKLFLSSPGDVDKERKEVIEVVEELNHTVCKFLKIRIEVLKWETDVIPGMGRPQELINKQIGQYDIFLGIMWKRFGTPTGVAGSGTEEEFNHAYSLWQQHPNLRILFYFSRMNFFPGSKKDIEQFGKVNDFHENIKSKGLVCEYDSPDSFANTIRPHLINLVKDIIENYRKEAVVEAAVSITQPNEKISTKIIIPIETLAADEYEKMQIPAAENIYSSFKIDGGKSFFLRLEIPTTPGYLQKEWHKSSIYIIRDPIRPYLIQIGETRSQRKSGNPDVIPELLNMELKELQEMYPFIYSGNFKWIRMVIAELSTKQDVLDYMHHNDPDHDVRKITANNPSASIALMSKECPFCNENFISTRRTHEDHAESPLTIIIRNDFPYGPYFHYMAIPKTPVHSWEDFTEELLYDLNLTLFNFLKRKIGNKKVANKSVSHIEGSPGVNIGFNSTIRHLVLTRHSRSSAGASISHVHKQAWGMSECSINLSDYLAKICGIYQKKKIDYLGKYLEALENNGFVIWSDEHVVLYVPIGQMSIHELQVMVRRKGTNSYIALNEIEIKSMSKAEALVIQIFKKLGINSFNEIMLTQPLNDDTSTFRLIIAFVTREVDLAVSELNHLYVVDNHPYDTIQAIMENLQGLEKAAKIEINKSFACFLNRQIC